jgi:hypothetical protein
MHSTKMSWDDKEIAIFPMANTLLFDHKVILFSQPINFTPDVTARGFSSLKRRQESAAGLKEAATVRTKNRSTDRAAGSNPD